MANKQRLIDADELKKWLKSPAGFRANCEDCVTADCLNCIIEEAIENAPTIEATPVVHGYWVDHYICSNCGKWSTAGLDADVWTSYEPPFCPNCGARMDGDGK